MSIPRAQAPDTFCTDCGAELTADEKFCGRCGHPRTAVTQVIPIERGAAEPTVDRSAEASPDPDEQRPRRRPWKVWAVAAALLALVASTAGFAISYSQTSGSLADARTSLSEWRDAAKERAAEIDRLNGQLADLEGDNSELGSLNSDLRAAAQACQKAVDLSTRYLQSIASVFAGSTRYESVLRLGRQLDDATTDCEARFTVLGF